MLLKLTGSSCSGKTTLALAMAGRLEHAAVHDFDETGVPERADHRWRQRMTEYWVRRALEYQDRGIDLLLTGQSPLGELLATPSAPRLDAIAVCLVDVADEVRRERLAARGPRRYDAARIEAFGNWAEWHRRHASDPRHQPEVITAGSWPAMAWHRWSGWNAGDPRWATSVLDTTGRPVAQCAADLEQWVAQQRDAHRSSRNVLGRGWADRTASHHAGTGT